MERHHEVTAVDGEQQHEHSCGIVDARHAFEARFVGWEGHDATIAFEDAVDGRRDRRRTGRSNGSTQPNEMLDRPPDDQPPLGPADHRARSSTRENSFATASQFVAAATARERRSRCCRSVGFRSTARTASANDAGFRRASTMPAPAARVSRARTRRASRPLDGGDPRRKRACRWKPGEDPGEEERRHRRAGPTRRARRRTGTCRRRTPNH